MVEVGMDENENWWFEKLMRTGVTKKAPSFATSLACLAGQTTTVRSTHDPRFLLPP